MVLTAVAGLVLAAGQANVQPWVFRAVFEDRPRQLIIALNRKAGATPVGFVFHPEIASIRKVWSGTIDYRGKVYDFSQNNSRTEGKTLWEAPSEAIRLPDQASATGWTADGVVFDNSWRFDEDGALLVSPGFELGRMQTVYVGFDEMSTSAAFVVRLLGEGGKELTKFESSTAQDSNWQWNYKKIPHFEGRLRLEISQKKQVDRKRIRNLRVFGDYPVWTMLRDKTVEPVEAELRSYRIDGPDDVTVTSRVGAAFVDWKPGVMAGTWSEKFTVRGLRPGQVLVLFRPGLDKNPVSFTNGETELRHSL